MVLIKYYKCVRLVTKWLEWETYLITRIKVWETVKYSIWWFSCWLSGALNSCLRCWTAFSSLPLLFLCLSLSPFSWTWMHCFFFFFSFYKVCQQQQIWCYFILDLIGYNNLIRHSKNVDILYKLLRLLEDREQIITENTKTNYQITNSADQPLTATWLAMNLPVNATTSGKNCRLQRAAPRLWVITRSGFAESVDL